MRSTKFRKLRPPKPMRLLMQLPLKKLKKKKMLHLLTQWNRTKMIPPMLQVRASQNRLKMTRKLLRKAKQ